VSISYEPDGLPWKYAIFDMENEQVIHLGDHPVRDHIHTLSVPEFVTFKALDGLILNGILTRAKGVTSAGPTIIHIHGGPAMAARWRYGQYTQFLVNRGYTVFDINFRGSAGYGKAFQQAGFREFGRKMQDDILDARNWLIDQGIADPKAIAVLGASYGGYASAMAMTRDAGVFAAGVVEIAMFDVEYQSRFPPLFWGLSLETWYRYFGNPSDEGVREEMRMHSPQSHIDKITGPLLIVAAREDRVVGYTQTKRFVMDAEALNKNVEFVVFDKAGHGLTRWQDKITHARRLEEFMAKHLGGRSGNWDWMELAAQYFD
jgi:dipeptidyl aminopeptidase/acylaminoacyl peptidase